MALTISIEGLGVIANADGTNDSAGGSWAEDGAGTLSYTTDTYLVGSGCIAGAYSNKAGYQYYDIGSGNELDFTPSTGSEAGQLLYIWISCPTLGLMDTIANKGLAIRLGTSLSAYREYIIGGQNDANGWKGEWKCFVLDPTKAGSVSDTGSYSYASVRYFGVWVDAAALAKGDNIFIDQMAVGTGLRITGTSTTPWSDLVSYCTDYANRGWGMIQEREGIYYAYGKLYWGDSTQGSASSFQETGAPIIQYGITEYWYSSAWTLSHPVDYAGMIIEDASSYTTTFDDGVIVGTDNGRSGSTIIGHPDLTGLSIDLYGGNNAGSLTRLYGTTFRGIVGGITWGNDSDHLFYGGTVSGCGQFDPVGAVKLRNVLFVGTVDSYTGGSTIDGSALLWNSNIDIQKCNFIANTHGTYDPHAIQVDTATTINMINLVFNGNDYDVHFTAASGDLTINASGTTNVSTSDVEGTGSVDIVNTKTLSIHVQDEDTNDVVGARVRIENYSTGAEISQGTTNGDGDYVDTTYNYAGDENVTVKVRLSPDGSTRYYPWRTIDTIRDSGLTLTATLIVDSIAV